MDDSKILLENGTNELMILEFKLGDNYYGINVAKIREITKYEPVTPIPNIIILPYLRLSKKYPYVYRWFSPAAPAGRPEKSQPLFHPGNFWFIKKGIYFWYNWFVKPYEPKRCLFLIR